MLPSGCEKRLPFHSASQADGDGAWDHPLPPPPLLPPSVAARPLPSGVGETPDALGSLPGVPPPDFLTCCSVQGPVLLGLVLGRWA